MGLQKSDIEISAKKGVLVQETSVPDTELNSTSIKTLRLFPKKY